MKAMKRQRVRRSGPHSAEVFKDLKSTLSTSYLCTVVKYERLKYGMEHIYNGSDVMAAHADGPCIQEAPTHAALPLHFQKPCKERCRFLIITILFLMEFYKECSRRHWEKWDGH